MAQTWQSRKPGTLLLSVPSALVFSSGPNRPHGLEHATQLQIVPEILLPSAARAHAHLQARSIPLQRTDYPAFSPQGWGSACVAKIVSFSRYSIGPGSVHSRHYVASPSAPHLLSCVPCSKKCALLCSWGLETYTRGPIR